MSQAKVTNKFVSPRPCLLNLSLISGKNHSASDIGLRILGCHSMCSWEKRYISRNHFAMEGEIVLSSYARIWNFSTRKIKNLVNNRLVSFDKRYTWKDVMEDETYVGDWSITLEKKIQVHCSCISFRQNTGSCDCQHLWTWFVWNNLRYPNEFDQTLKFVCSVIKYCTFYFCFYNL